MSYKLHQGIIRISGMEFFAYHGVNPEEQIIGNRYKVDIEARAQVSQAALHDKLEGTVDYGELHRISAAVMQQSAKLLEYLAYQIAEQSLDQLAELEEITVRVRKQNPPVGGLVSESSAEITLSR
jgi:dihydroneopterin aldolase